MTALPSDVGSAPTGMPNVKLRVAATLSKHLVSMANAVPIDAASMSAVIAAVRDMFSPAACQSMQRRKGSDVKPFGGCPVSETGAHFQIVAYQIERLAPVNKGRHRAAQMRIEPALSAGEGEDRRAGHRCIIPARFA